MSFFKEKNMAVSKEEELIEREKLKKTAQVLDDEITLLQKRTKILLDDLQEFKMLAWQDFSSFDAGDITQAKSSTEEEESKVLREEDYLKRLLRIKGKPYFASIVYQDNEESEKETIYISTTYLKDKDKNNIVYDWRSPICSLF